MTNDQEFIRIDAVCRAFERGWPVESVADLCELADHKLSAESRERLIFELYCCDFECHLSHGHEFDGTRFETAFPEHIETIRRAAEECQQTEVEHDGFVNSARTTLPDRIGEFEIVREIGRGGMGIVFEARQASLQRTVAIKVLPNAQLLPQSALKRFSVEAKAVGQLHHSNIVEVFGTGTDSGLPYIAMQFIQGETLGDQLRQVVDEVTSPNAMRNRSTGTRNLVHYGSTDPSSATSETCGQLPVSARPPSCFDAQTVAEIGQQVASALAYAHEKGVLHRDIKPNNLMRDTNGTTFITDFGLARLWEGDESLTGTSDVIGTLRYLAPEMLSGQSDVRSDVYGLGITLYELVTGEPAWPQTDRAALLKARSGHAEPEPLARKIDVPQDLAVIIGTAIRHDPEARYQTAGELAEDLERFLKHEPISARRVTVRERFHLWRKRNPVVAALSMGLFTVALLAIVVITNLWLEATTATETAETRADRLAEAQSELTASRDEAKQSAIEAKRAASDSRDSANDAIKQRLIAQRSMVKLQDANARRHMERDELSQALLWTAAALSRIESNNELARRVGEQRVDQSAIPLDHMLRLRFAEIRRRLPKVVSNVQLPAWFDVIPVNLIVPQIVFKGDGRIGVIAGWRGAYREYELTSGKLITDPQSPPPGKRYLYTQDARWAVHHDGDKLVLWDVDQNRVAGPLSETTAGDDLSEKPAEQATAPGPSQPTKAESALNCWHSPAFNLVVVETDAPAFIAWNTNTRQLHGRLELAGSPGRTGRVVADGKYLLYRIGNRSSAVNLQNMTAPVSIKGRLGDVSPDGTWVVEAAANGVKSINLKNTSVPHNTFSGPAVYTALFTDGQHVVARSRHQILAYRLSDENSIPREIAQITSPIQFMASSTASGWIAMASQQGLVQCWSANSSVKPTYRISGAPAAIAWDDDGRQFAVLTRSGRLYVWRLPSEPIQSLGKQSNKQSFIQHARFSPDGNKLLIVDSTELRCVDSRSHEELWSRAGRHVWDAVWSGDGKRLAVTMADEQFKVFTASGEELASVKRPPRTPGFGFAMKGLSHDGKTAFVVDKTELVVFDDSGKQLWEENTKYAPVYAVRFIGDQLVVARRDFNGNRGVVSVFEARTGNALKKAEMQLKSPLGFRHDKISHDGRTVAFADGNGLGIVRIGGDTKRISVADQKVGQVAEVEFTSDDAHLIVRGKWNEVRVLRTQDWQPVGAAFRVRGGVQTQLAIASYGLVATAGTSGHVRFWDWHRGIEVLPPLRQPGNCDRLEISADEERFSFCSPNEPNAASLYSFPEIETAPGAELVRIAEELTGLTIDPGSGILSTVNEN